MYKRATLTVASVFLAACQAFSATLLVQNNFTPPSNLAVNRFHPGPILSAQSANVRENRDNAQTFTISSATTIDQIAIQFEGAQTATTAQATFEFFAVTNANSATLSQSGSVLDSFTLTGSSFGGATSGLLIFDIADTSAAAGSTWGIRFDTQASVLAPGLFNWIFSYKALGTNAFGSNYPDGSFYQTGNANSGQDYAFGVVSVPEPSTTNMLLAAIGTLLSMKRQRRKRLELKV